MYFYIITVQSAQSYGEKMTSTRSGLISEEEFPTAQMRYEAIFAEACKQFGHPSGRTAVMQYYIEKN